MSTQPPYPGYPESAPQNPVFAAPALYPTQPPAPYATQAAAPDLSPYPGPAQPGDKRPVTAIVSLVLGVVVFGGTLIAKIGAAATTDTPEGVLSALGMASFFSLVLIIPAIVLAHLAVNHSSKGKRIGRGMAVGALVLAYVDLALFLVRIVAAGIATVGYDDPSSFFYNMFFWV